jgi:hypothetical protein
VATVTSQLTRIHDLEGGLTVVSIGGGAGAAANTDIFLQAAQSLGRRQSNVTVHGFMIDDGAGNDLSAADVHVGAWLWHTHFAVLTALRLRVASNSASGDYDEHTIPLTEYPPEGGWLRIWIDISRTPENTGGSALDEATARYFGPTASLPSVGGNAANLVLDAVDHATAGLLLTGTSGVFQDFLTADPGNTTNKYGVVTQRSGIIFCQARLTFGSSSSLAFSDSGFTIVFPQQSLVGSAFMGVTCDLQHASTAITFTGGSFQSPGAVKGDFVVTGTTGALTASGCAFSGLRIVTLTSACTMPACVFRGTGVITAAGADLDDSVFSGYEGSANSSLLVWNVNTDPDGKLNNTAFTKGTAATHAIEFGTTSPTTMTLRGIAFSGYNASHTQNDSTLHIKRTTGDVTINLIGCTGNISYRSDGANVILVVDPVTTLITTRNSAGAVVASVRVLVEAGDGTGDLPFEETVTISRSGSVASVAHTAHGLVAGDKVAIRGAVQQEYNGVFAITNITTNAYDYTVSGSPATPATGTIKSTGVVLEGLTNGSGVISASRTFTVDQNVRGKARKSTTAPFFKSSDFTDVVDSLVGLTKTVQMTSDQ